MHTDGLPELPPLNEDQSSSVEPFQTNLTQKILQGKRNEEEKASEPKQESEGEEVKKLEESKEGETIVNPNPSQTENIINSVSILNLNDK